MLSSMKAQLPPIDEATRTDLSREHGYTAWKRTKVERAVAEAKAREGMIPAEQVWRDLGLEG